MKSPSPSPAEQGFSLVEICLALAIATFALLAIFGLLPVGIESNHASVRQTEATSLATGIVEDLRQTEPGASAVSPRYGIPFDQAATEFFIDAGGNRSPQDTAAYRVKISLVQPTAGKRNATRASVTLGWPAAGEPPANSMASFVALDRN